MDILAPGQDSLLVDRDQYPFGPAAEMGAGPIYAGDAEACVPVPEGGELTVRTGMGAVGEGLAGNRTGGHRCGG